MTDDELRAAQDAAVAAAGDRTSKPGGIAAAVAESHDAARLARAEADAHERVAAMLTDTALAADG